MSRGRPAPPAAPAHGRVLFGLRLGRDRRAEAARLLAPPLRLLTVRELLGPEGRRDALEEYTFLLGARGHGVALRLVHDLGRRQPQGGQSSGRGRRPQRRRCRGERRGSKHVVAHAHTCRGCNLDQFRCVGNQTFATALATCIQFGRHSSSTDGDATEPDMPDKQIWVPFVCRLVALPILTRIN